MRACDTKRILTGLLITASAVTAAGPPERPGTRPDLLFGVFFASIEEGARVMGPIEFLPREHPGAAGHDFPNPEAFHRSEVEVLVELGRHAGLGLRATLERYPRPPTDAWPYPEFRPPDPRAIASGHPLRTDAAPALPGLRAVAVRDGQPLAFVLDTRGMSLEARGMRRPTTMGLDLTREDFLSRLGASIPESASSGAWIVIYPR